MRTPNNKCFLFPYGRTKSQHNPKITNKIRPSKLKHALGAISMAQLRCSHNLHLPPINVVVSNAPLILEHSSLGRFRT